MIFAYAKDEFIVDLTNFSEKYNNRVRTERIDKWFKYI